MHHTSSLSIYLSLCIFFWTDKYLHIQGVSIKLLLLVISIKWRCERLFKLTDNHLLIMESCLYSSETDELCRWRDIETLFFLPSYDLCHTVHNNERAVFFRGGGQNPDMLANCAVADAAINLMLESMPGHRKQWQMSALSGHQGGAAPFSFRFRVLHCSHIAYYVGASTINGSSKPETEINCLWSILRFAEIVRGGTKSSFIIYRVSTYLVSYSSAR